MADDHDDVASITFTAMVRPPRYPGEEPGPLKSGELISMHNGTFWFHPNDGSPPFRVRLLLEAPDATPAAP